MRCIMKKCNFFGSSKIKDDVKKSYVVKYKVKQEFRVKIDWLIERGDKIIPKEVEWRLDQNYPIHNDVESAISYAKLKLNQRSYRPGDAVILEFHESSEKVKASFLSGNPTLYLYQITDICKYLPEYQPKEGDKLEVKLDPSSKNYNL